MEDNFFRSAPKQSGGTVDKKLNLDIFINNIVWWGGARLLCAVIRNTLIIVEFARVLYSIYIKFCFIYPLRCCVLLVEFLL